jgi:hypothetical protein
MNSVISSGIKPVALIFISKRIAVSPIGGTELAQPIKDKSIECCLLVGIALYAGHDVVIDDKEGAPLLIRPRVTRNGLKGFVAIEVCYYYKGGIHALDSATTIATPIAPVHTGLPVIIIVTHGHVIHGVDRETHSAMVSLLVEATGMRETELLKAGEIISLCDLGKHLYRLTASIDMENLTIGQREVKRRSSIRVASKDTRIAKPIIHLCFRSPSTTKTTAHTKRNEMIKGVIKLIHIALATHFLMDSLFNFIEGLLIFKGAPQNELVTEKMIEILLVGRPEAQEVIEAASLGFIRVIGFAISIGLTIGVDKFKILGRKLVENIHIFSLFHLIYILYHIFLLFSRRRNTSD